MQLTQTSRYANAMRVLISTADSFPSSSLRKSRVLGSQQAAAVGVEAGRAQTGCVCSVELHPTWLRRRLLREARNWEESIEGLWRPEGDMEGSQLIVNSRISRRCGTERPRQTVNESTGHLKGASSEAAARASTSREDKRQTGQRVVPANAGVEGTKRTWQNLSDAPSFIRHSGR